VTAAAALPPVVDRATWQHQRDQLLRQEKALMHLKDLVSAQRRRLPMVEVRADYRFDGDAGSVTLADLFAGRPQLILQHAMYAPEWEEGCSGCSMMAEHVGPLSHLHARRTSFAMVSRAPLPQLLAFRERMGWDLPWYSSAGTTFNDDFGTTVDGEEHHAISVFLAHEGRVFHTWSTYDRGEEPFMQVFDLLDLTPYGRQEEWEDSPPGWPQGPTFSWMRLADRYDDGGGSSCCG
jgi:predicted dithiol-disulfide oxidoreductase (DUF899 family)